jgi:putative PIN family toxin of toxin-antitoxin system
MKLVLDTNTLISGSLWAGAPAQLLEAVSRGQVAMAMSPDLLAELAAVAARPKFALRIAARGTTPVGLVQKLAREVTILSPARLPSPPELRDPKDLPVLACAVAAGADAIVSGDKDLLVLGFFQGIPIIGVREALERLGLADP